VQISISIAGVGVAGSWLCPCLQNHNAHSYILFSRWFYWKVLYENVRIYQQPFSKLLKSKEMNPIFKALLKKD